MKSHFFLQKWQQLLLYTALVVVISQIHTTTVLRNTLYLKLLSYVDTSRRETVFLQLFTDISSLQSSKKEQQKLRRHIASLEVENASLKEKLRAYEQLKSLSVDVLSKKNIETIAVQITRSSNRWILSSGTAGGLRVHSPLYAQGSYIGFISSLDETMGIASIWTDDDSKIGVIHQSSRAMGILSHEHGKIVIEFFTRVEKIEPGDLLLTIGDEVGVPVAVPIAKVEKNITKDADPVSKVIGLPLATISPGDIVQTQK